MTDRIDNDGEASLEERARAWLPEARERLTRLAVAPRLDHVGRVQKVGDGVAEVTGLPETRLDELLLFEEGSFGLAVRLDDGRVGCVLLRSSERLAAGTRVHGSGQVIRVPVGEALLGRVIDPLCQPLDGGPEITGDRLDPVQRPAPGIIERAAVTQPLMTGLTVVDSMIPLGRGQRELIIGDRKTGKTSIAVDSIISQRQSDVICIYAAVGQKASSVNQVIESLRANAAFERCIVMVGEASMPAGAQWLVPYSACALAEYFRDRGQHALLVIDDLTKHANVHRQLSLLLRNPPGREAYPGDVFHIHARLLERAAKLSDEQGGGSLTALPIAETQAGNLSAYIPTNLISITDGQIYMEPKLFYEGQKPAVNIGLSVSRVGGATQSPAMRKASEELRLRYAQFLELEVFTRFGGMLDERTRKTIEHGKRIRAILTQPSNAPLGLAEQVLLLLAVQEGKLDALGLEEVAVFRARLPKRLTGRCAATVSRVEASGELSDADRGDFLDLADGLIAEITAERPAKADDDPAEPGKAAGGEAG